MRDREQNNRMSCALIKSNNNRVWFNYICTENKIDGI